MPAPDTFHVSHALYNRLRDDHGFKDSFTSSILAPWMAPRICASHAFPTAPARCSRCEGTGEGDDSTYCHHCDGAGEIISEGVFSNGHTTVLFKRDLPKKFEPRCTFAVPAPKLCRGLP